MVGPVLLLFLGGAADFGFAVYCRGRLAAAVSAGAEYAVLTAARKNPVNASDVSRLVANVSALGLGSNDPTVSVDRYCLENASSNPKLALNSTVCPDGSTPRIYAVITATYRPTLLVPIAPLIGGINITESASVELR